MVGDSDAWALACLGHHKRVAVEEGRHDPFGHEDMHFAGADPGVVEVVVLGDDKDVGSHFVAVVDWALALDYSSLALWNEVLWDELLLAILAREAWVVHVLPLIVHMEEGRHESSRFEIATAAVGSDSQVKTNLKGGPVGWCYTVDMLKDPCIRIVHAGLEHAERSLLVGYLAVLADDTAARFPYSSPIDLLKHSRKGCDQPGAAMSLIPTHIAYAILNCWNCSAEIGSIRYW